MNDNTVAGKFDQVKGKIKQSVGEAVGDQRMANSGTADQVKGAAKEGLGHVQDAAHAVKDDAATRTRATEGAAAYNDSTGRPAAGHDVRQKVVSTAQNMKEAIENKADEIRDRHRRSA